MNVLDVNVDEAIKRLAEQAGTDEPLRMMWERQTELLRGYEEIERRNSGYHPHAWPLNLHDHREQKHLKDLAWRVVEELAEAQHAMMDWDNARAAPNFDAHLVETHRQHIGEELADATHFFLEMLLLAGWNPEVWLSGWGTADLRDVFHCLEEHRVERGTAVGFDRPFTNFVGHLGWSMGSLKNRSWKSTQMLTDLRTFQSRIDGCFGFLIDVVISLGFSCDEWLELYVAKSEVNLWRQKTKY